MKELIPMDQLAALARFTNELESQQQRKVRQRTERAKKVAARLKPAPEPVFSDEEEWERLMQASFDASQDGF